MFPISKGSHMSGFQSAISDPLANAFRGLLRKTGRPRGGTGEIAGFYFRDSLSCRAEQSRSGRGKRPVSSLGEERAPLLEIIAGGGLSPIGASARLPEKLPRPSQICRNSRTAECH